MSKRGKLIVFEGIDGCGKTSQIEKLYEKLKDIGVKVALAANIVEGSPSGRAIREILSGKGLAIDNMRLATIYLSELRYSVKKENGIEQLLEEGYTVLCSRWFYSTYAYAGTSFEVNKVIELSTLDLPKPDITFHLNVDVDTAIERMGGEGDMYEKKDKLYKINSRYTMIIEEGKIHNIMKINNMDSFENVNQNLFELVQHLGV